MISVIVPFWGNFNLDWYDEALDSVYSQTYKGFEIVEPPLTEEVETAKGVSGRLAKCRNLMIAKAKGEFILNLDADDKIHETYLKKALKLMEERQVDIVYTQIQWFGTHNEMWPLEDFSPETLKTHNYITCCSLFKKEIWEKYPYAEDMYWGYEDYDFWLGAVKNGYKAALLAEPLFYYRRRPGQMIESCDPRQDELLAKIRSHHKELYEND